MALTQNYLSKSSDGTDIAHLTDSIIYDDGTNVGIGTSSPSNKVHIANAGSSTYIVSDVFCTTDNYCTRIRLVKSNSNTLGTLSATGEFDLFGRIEGLGVNSTGSAVKIAALIDFSADGSPTSTRVPGEINFWTSSTSSAEQRRMTIKSDGKVGIGETDPDSELEVKGTIHATNLDGAATNLTVNASGQIIRDPSDRMLKKNIKRIKGALEKVLQLRGVSFDWRAKACMGTSGYGMVAQEVGAVIPGLVSKSKDGTMGVRYTNMIGLLVEAIKEQQTRISGLENLLKKVGGKKSSR